MKLIRQSATIVTYTYGLLDTIEKAGRICYQSEPKEYIGANDWKFVRGLIKRGHHSVLEHGSITVKFITNRGVTHELVRHRIAAYSQESTRYCNYGGKDMEFIKPVWWDDTTDTKAQFCFRAALKQAERQYNNLLEHGWSPQQAREVLPNALKTEIYCTMNVREWRHVFTLRCSKAAHPQMRALMLDLLNQFQRAWPCLFEDIIFE